MRIYLDNCSLQRPLDDKSQVRVALESEAILAILSLCETEKIILLSSDVLLFEVEKNPIMLRREHAFEILKMAKQFLSLTPEIVERARELELAGIKALDALHLACAELAEADYFCTCDARLLRKARSLLSPSLRLVSPLELASELTDDL